MPADEIPPAPSESADDVTKSETIRITLPPKSEQPAVKRETVRINVPGKPVPPPGTAPKKETTRLPGGADATTPATPSAPPPPATATKPFVPPPAPKPPGAPLPAPPSGLTPPPKPISAVAPPPKPPSLGGRPTAPLKPAPPAPSGGPTPPPEPMTVRTASPKKETARITLPPEGAKPPLPKATVKMQQTVPLTTPRPSGIQQAPATIVQQAPTLTQAAGPKADPLVGGLSIAALIAAIAAVATTYMAYAETLPK